MNVRLYLISLPVIFLLGFSSAIAQPGKSIDSKLEAAKLAVTYLGEDFITKDIDDIARQAQVITLVDTTTPFLWSLTSRDRVWKVWVRDVDLSSLLSGSAAKDAFRDFDVYLDSLTGRLLKIECHHGDQTELLKHPLERLEKVEATLRRGNIYGSIPLEVPKVGFIEALMPLAMEAEEILGQYVNHQTRFAGRAPNGDTATTPVACWIISLAGIPPRQAMGGDISFLPEYTRNRERLIVNSRTGRLRSTSSYPSVPLTPEDRERIFPGLIDSLRNRR